MNNCSYIADDTNEVLLSEKGITIVIGTNTVSGNCLTEIYQCVPQSLPSGTEISRDEGIGEDICGREKTEREEFPNFLQIGLSAVCFIECRSEMEADGDTDTDLEPVIRFNEHPDQQQDECNGRKEIWSNDNEPVPFTP